jgi:nucleoside phosphorylase
MSRRSLKADIGIITVIPRELESVRVALGFSNLNRSTVRKSGRIYHIGNLESGFDQRPYRVALTCIGDAGTEECAVTATSLIHQCCPRLVLLVGIAAGEKGKTKIGSVILSERVWDYEREALDTGRRGRIKRIPRPNVLSLPFKIQQDIMHYLSMDGFKARIDQRFQSTGGKYPTQITYKGKPTVISDPEVESATVASGKKLLRNPRFLYSLRIGSHGRIKVAEMEASGLSTACHQENTYWLVIRSVSDFGDRSKNDEYHRFALQMAAATLRDFIERGLDLSLRAPPKRKRNSSISANAGVWPASGLDDTRLS